MEELTAAHFTAGTCFEVEAAGTSVPLTLERVEPLPPAAREAGAFRLDFTGPADPLLPQGIYPFDVGGTVHGIFIVPLERKADGCRYEAIFN